MRCKHERVRSCKGERIQDRSRDGLFFPGDSNEAMEMKVLENEMLEVVSGGDAAQDTAAVAANAETAVSVCGQGKVASVSTTGFTCKK